MAVTSWATTPFTSRADFTAHASSTSEVSLLTGGSSMLPTIPALTFDSAGWGRRFRFHASGVISTTGTPTMTFILRLGTTGGAAFVTGTTIAASAAITTTSGASAEVWELDAVFNVNTPGHGTGNMTVSGHGRVQSPAGFASPFVYMLTPSGGDSGTWTSTHDGSLTQYLNLTGTWSANSASNTITCKDCALELLN